MIAFPVEFVDKKGFWQVLGEEIAEQPLSKHDGVRNGVGRNARRQHSACMIL